MSSNFAFKTDAFPSETQLKDMMEKALLRQEELNRVAYDTAWVKKGLTGEFDYPLAAGFEIFELGVSWNRWCWWSKSTPNAHDLLNMRVEIVDALHFILSDILLAYNGSIPNAANDCGVILNMVQKTIETFDNDFDQVMYVKSVIKRLFKYAGQEDSYRTKATDALRDLYMLAIHACGLGFREIGSMYFAKSVLNRFRQEHGYREKKYTKIWKDGGIEDNHVLMGWVAENPNAKEEAIHEFLSDQYVEVLKEKARREQKEQESPASR